MSGPVFTLDELSAAVGGSVEGDSELRITGVAGLSDAAPGTLVRVESEKYLRPALESAASVLLLPHGLGPVSKPCIRVEHVKRAFIRCLELFAPPEAIEPGIHPTAVIGDGTELGAGCQIGPYAVLGRGVRVGNRTVIHAHAVLMDGVEVGPECVVYPNATLYPNTLLGARVRIHSGASIGADGYGYEWTGQKHQKIPQNGRVRLEDDVEVGANAAIDRATTGETVIGAGCKIDNLVQIGHNVRTGPHCILVSQVGVAGSTTLGAGVVLAGQSGVKDHVTVGDGVQAGGRAGIWGDLPAGSIVSGNPVRPHREYVKIQAALGKLPDLIRRVRELEKRVGGE